MANPRPNRNRRPQRPTHPVGAKPPVYKPAKPRPTRIDRRLVIDRAVGAVRNALMESGTSPADSLRLARVLLTRPGVTLGKGGNIFYKGTKYDPAAFAASDLAKLASGATAQAKNEAAIKGDPGYLQALANLGLARDQATAGLEDQRRQALIQFGDPSFVTDPTLAGQASANPFSDTRLLDAAYQQQQRTTANAANRYGVSQGGGLVSGQAGDQRAYAAQQQDAVTKLQALLQSIGQQEASAQQAYGVGQQQASLDAYNALLASGAITAAHAPNWHVGNFAVKGYGNLAGGGGGGGGGAAGPRPGGPPRGNLPTQTTYPGGGPIIYGNAGQPVGNTNRGPTQTNYPIPGVDMGLLRRKYGLYG